MQTIIQDTITSESLVRFYVDGIPYAGVVLRMITPVLALVRVQMKDGPKKIEIEASKLSARS